MILVAHRINKISDLKKINVKNGIEIDIRDNLNKLEVVHDPFKKGVLLKKFLKNYNHSFLICNIKSERIEYRVKRLLKKEKIKNYFFLDSSFPMIIEMMKKKIRNIAIRVSKYESYLTALNLKNKIEWIWYDAFEKLPNKRELNRLKKLNFKICLVSPELHKKIIHKKTIQNFLKVNHGLIDMVCTKSKYFKKWNY